jgi:hypothetical protein
MKPILGVLILLATFAGTAAAQEFGRTSGGEIDVATKSPAKLSGSLGFSLFSQDAKRYEASFGGTIIDDRLWFFGTAERGDRSSFQHGVTEYTEPLRALRVSVVSTPAQDTTQPPLTMPRDFLTLHYTGILSSNSFFTAMFSRSSASPR